MATGKEKRLPVLQAIVSTSVNAKFASCGEREGHFYFTWSHPPLPRRTFIFAWSCKHFSPFSFFFFSVTSFTTNQLLNTHTPSIFCIPASGFLWAHSSETHFSLLYNITSSLLITLLLFFSHSQIDPKVAFPRRAQPKVRINWSLTLLKENDYVSSQQLT